MRNLPRPLQAKTRVKRLIQRVLPTDLPPVIVASMGRSGSTLICDALRDAFARKRFPGIMNSQGSRVVSDPAWDLDVMHFRPGVVYKTHGLSEELPDGSGARVVFLFGSATDAALSVLACRDRFGEDWIKLHFEHLRASGTFDELGDRDVLRFGDQLDGWLGKSGTPRIAMHYDALWDHQRTLSEFVGAEIQLPKRRARSGSKAADAATRARFADTYAELDAKIASMPTCQVLD